jgi:hypothetical protein
VVDLLRHVEADDLSLLEDLIETGEDAGSGAHLTAGIPFEVLVAGGTEGSLYSGCRNMSMPARAQASREPRRFTPMPSRRRLIDFHRRSISPERFLSPAKRLFARSFSSSCLLSSTSTSR